MKAQELRIGNWVYEIEDAIQVEVVDISNLYYNDFNDGTIIYTPIPLTEEWLVKFGFKPLSNDWQKDGIIIHTRKRGYVLRKSVPIVKYVHNLQNLYFALTGKELI